MTNGTDKEAKLERLRALPRETGSKDKFYRHDSTQDLGIGSGVVYAIQHQF